MTIKPVLWTHEPHKDGRCPIKIYIARKYLPVPKIAVHPNQGKPIYFEDIDQNFYGEFWQFLHTEFGIQKAGGFSKHIKVLKKIHE